MSAISNDHAPRHADDALAERLVGSPAPAMNAPHEGLTGPQVPPIGDDPRPGNVGRAGEAPKPDDLVDILDNSSAESFPASDPPSWSAGATTGEERPAPSTDPDRHGLGRVIDEDGDGQTPDPA